MRALKLKMLDEAAEFLNSDPDCLNAASYVELKSVLVERFKSKNTHRFFRSQVAGI